MLSHAQNGEDVVLNRAFKGQASGFYIDIGAWDPDICSVTKHFYDLGWRGVNIEPVEGVYQKLASARPHDINLSVAVGNRPNGKAKFVEYQTEGLSGFAESLFHDNIVAAGWGTIAKTFDVEVISLAAIAHEHAPLQVDFVKIDVEGAEREVIESADWKAFRPRVVVVESIVPFTNEPAWDSWEHLMLMAGYEFTLFDGINRFYHRAEEPALKGPLSVPANVTDGYVTAHVHTLHQRIGEVEATVSRLTGELSQMASAREAALRELTDLKTSIFWRSTGPVRKAVDMLKSTRTT